MGVDNFQVFSYFTETITFYRNDEIMAIYTSILRVDCPLDVKARAV